MNIKTYFYRSQHIEIPGQISIVLYITIEKIYDTFKYYGVYIIIKVYKWKYLI